MTDTGTPSGTSTPAEPSPKATSGRHLTLGTRIFLATAMIVALAIGTAVAITWLLGNRVGYDAASQALERSGLVQDTFQERRFQLLGLVAEQLAGDPSFSGYVVESLEQGDVDSLLDQLDERRTALGFDFAMVVDPDGIVFARTDAPEATGDDFSDEILYQLAYDGYEAIGIWATGQGLYYGVAVPVAAGGLLHGFLIAAYAIDDRAASELRDINDTQVVYLRSEGSNLVPVASTLAPGAVEDLQRGLTEELLAGLASADSVQSEFEIDRRRSLAVVRPVTDVSDERVGLVVHLASLDVKLDPYRRVGRNLLIVGVVALLLALVVSYFLPKRVLQPMVRLTRAAKAAAEGDYDQPIPIDRGDEVGQLATAFSALLSELREKRDMEVYVNELARNVPDADGASPEAKPAESRDLALLGIEVRPGAGELSGGTTQNAGEVLDRLTRDVRRINRSVAAQGGKLEGFFGNRLVASYEGPRRTERALGTAAQLAGTQGSGGTQLALALVAGPVVSGTVASDNHPQHTLTGAPMAEVETLLRLSQGGLLMAESARRELADTLEQSKVEARAHQSTVLPRPLYALEASQLGLFATSDFTATQQMTAALGTSAGSTTSPHTLSGIGIGAVLGGRFEILSELGAGGMGVVYKARDRSLGELVALKMLKANVFGDSENLERLKEELRLARKISHPNILRTYDFGEAGGLPFISMEFVRGITLRQLLDRSGRLPLTAGLRTARQLCRGLIAAHAEGVLHRDIKPENLIIEHTGNLKLMDFGIARPIARRKPAQTEPGALVGTPFYLAPEQLEGFEPDERADLYAAGVVLYEIFTGALPFSTQGNLFEIIGRKLQEPPTPPREHWAAMPESLVDILMLCLTRDRDRRFQTVATLLDRLEVLRA